MKTPNIAALSFLAAVAAVLLLPLSAAAAASALTVTGTVLLLSADYGRANGTVLSSPQAGVRLAAGSPSHLRLAA